VIEKNMDLKSAVVKVNDPSALMFDNGRKIIPLKEKDLTVTVNKTVLKPEEYEIVSVTNNRFLGKAEIVLSGKGKYGGTKTVKVSIGAKSLR
jgi:hypothetical protein